MFTHIMRTYHITSSQGRPCRRGIPWTWRDCRNNIFAVKSGGQHSRCFTGGQTILQEKYVRSSTGSSLTESQKRSFLELGRSAPVIAWNQQVKCSSSGQIGRCKPEHPDRDPARHLWSWRVYPVFSGFVPAWKTEKSLEIQESRSFSRCCFHSLWQALLANIPEYLIWTGKGTWVSGKSEIQLVDSIGERELFCISTSCHRSQTCSDHVQQCQFLES